MRHGIRLACRLGQRHTLRLSTLLCLPLSAALREVTLAQLTPLLALDFLLLASLVLRESVPHLGAHPALLAGLIEHGTLVLAQAHLAVLALAASDELHELLHHTLGCGVLKDVLQRLRADGVHTGLLGLRLLGLHLLGLRLLLKLLLLDPLPNELGGGVVADLRAGLRLTHPRLLREGIGHLAAVVSHHLPGSIEHGHALVDGLALEFADLKRFLLLVKPADGLERLALREQLRDAVSQRDSVPICLHGEPSRGFLRQALLALGATEVGSLPQAHQHLALTKPGAHTGSRNRTEQRRLTCTIHRHRCLTANIFTCVPFDRRGVAEHVALCPGRREVIVPRNGITPTVGDGRDVRPVQITPAAVAEQVRHALGCERIIALDDGDAHAVERVRPVRLHPSKQCRLIGSKGSIALTGTRQLLKARIAQLVVDLHNCILQSVEGGRIARALGLDHVAGEARALGSQATEQVSWCG